MIEDCVHCKAPMCISHISLFKNLTPSQQALIVSHVNRKVLHKKEVFMHEGDTLTCFVIVSQGRFKATANTIDGKQNVLTFYSIGDFFGEQALFEKEILPYRIEALEDSVLCMIDAITMKELMKNHVDIAISIISALSHRVSTLEQKLTRTPSEKIKDRLLVLLYDLSKDYGKQQEHTIRLRTVINQEEMAIRLGVSRESINRNLKKLHNDKLIQIVSSKEIILPRL